ncbi:MAG: ester cyclase [Thermoleophilia bacterium]|nr:ester cyclase [Thermoleophilia bacterium]
MTDLRAVAQRYADEVWNAKNLEAADELFTADHVYHDPLIPDLPPGPEGVKQRRGAFMMAMSDAVVTVNRWIMEGDLAAAMWTYSGTNDGEMMGMPATGKRAEIEGVHVFRFEGERIAESWVFGDTLGLLQQLGLVQLGVPAAS